ncbi:MAG: M23 family metallopeptidase [Actinomycetaceae bacterium]|nr:M23 family metallopeptidase [Actinomycetaceae bacterium]
MRPSRVRNRKVPRAKKVRRAGVLAGLGIVTVALPLSGIVGINPTVARAQEGLDFPLEDSWAGVRTNTVTMKSAAELSAVAAPASVARVRTSAEMAKCQVETSTGERQVFANENDEVVMPLPENSFVYASPFGARYHPIFHTMKVHEGVDMAAPQGTPVFAIADGEVTEVGPNGGGGNTIYIKHTLKNGETFSSGYLHLLDGSMRVKVGDKVKAGQVIANVGSTGNSTGPHLHFEIRPNKDPIDPVPWLKEHQAVPVGTKHC